MQHNSNQIINSEKLMIELVNLITKKVVARYISLTVIPDREREDVEMAIIEKFLIKKDKINQSFRGKSKITTYYTAVINRMCCEVIRKEQKHWYSVIENLVVDSDKTKTVFLETAKKTIIKDEVKRLSRAMLFFNGNRHKVNLFLKYYFDIPLKDEDIELYCNDLYEQVKDILNKNSSIRKSYIYDNLSQIVNIVEDKNVGADAARIWLKKQINTILTLMNAGGQYHYNQESLSVLFELYNQN
ncbi:MAG: hypothetical protein R6U11_06330 [Bacteroidales bacterium]